MEFLLLKQDFFYFSMSFLTDDRSLALEVSKNNIKNYIIFIL